MHITSHIPYEEGMHDVLQPLVDAVDQEFTPPLSQRSSTQQNDFAQSGQVTHVYVAQLCAQDVLIAHQGDHDTGFLSYLIQDHYSLVGLHQPVTYVTTVAVHPDFRGCKIAQTLYGELLQRTHRPVVVRTWSTNSSHINLLLKLGFEERHRLINHRGPDVDTIYFALNR